MKKLIIAFIAAIGLISINSASAADNTLKLMRTSLHLPALSESARNNRIAFAADRSKKDAICTACHDESEKKPILSIYQTKHGVKGDVHTPSCQACHGESVNHVKGKSTDGSKGRPSPEIVFTKGSYKASPYKDLVGACQSCHQNDEGRTHWDSSKHQNNEVACSTCHVVHAPVDKVLVKKEQAEVCYSCHKDQRAQSKHMSVHPIEDGKVTCSDCHQPHGSPADKALVKETINATCFTCHAEKRGPFLWEHQPATEDCTSCHVAHGSNIAPLLKSRSPFLCEECHNGPHQSSRPLGMGVAGVQAGLIGAAPPTGSAGRACLNCHVMVHGSNSTSGALLHR